MVTHTNKGTLSVREILNAGLPTSIYNLSMRDLYSYQNKQPISLFSDKMMSFYLLIVGAYLTL